jgi:uncharacterized protein involved in exopolysaccharide biosynthesis
MTDPAEEAKRFHNEINALREKLSTLNQLLDENIQRLAAAHKNQSPIPRSTAR